MIDTFTQYQKLCINQIDHLTTVCRVHSLSSSSRKRLIERSRRQLYKPPIARTKSLQQINNNDAMRRSPYSMISAKEFKNGRWNSVPLTTLATTTSISKSSSILDGSISTHRSDRRSWLQLDYGKKYVHETAV
ncbi:unnamed protein product [Trichobilharzia szidati]|nr:unnamed protein product [Trichobilharzia szidati]